MNKQMLEVSEKIKKDMSEKRYQHTIGVMYTCACLAMKYDYDIEKAMWAGLLHDVAKHFSDEDMLKKCKKHGIEISDNEKKAPYLLHGRLGAYYAKKKYNINDEDILDAISYHTTGRPGMGKLACILFIADYTEPGRKEIPGLKEVRECAFNVGLTEAVVMKIENVLSYLEKSSKNIDDMTMKTYLYFKEDKNE